MTLIRQMALLVSVLMSQIVAPGFENFTSVTERREWERWAASRITLPSRPSRYYGNFRLRAVLVIEGKDVVVGLGMLDDTHQLHLHRLRLCVVHAFFHMILESVACQAGDN